MSVGWKAKAGTNDSLMATTEGIAKAAEFLKGVLIREPKPTAMHWA